MMMNHEHHRYEEQLEALGADMATVERLKAHGFRAAVLLEWAHQYGVGALELIEKVVDHPPLNSTDAPDMPELL